eukprot:3762601-Pyramimonas_sp.AAC.1
MPLPPYDEVRYGPELLDEWLGDLIYRSKEITTILRHEIHYKKFHIDQCLDRRVNIWSNTAQQSWKVPSHWKSCRDMVQWKFQERRGHHNGPSTEAAIAHFRKD